MNSITTTPKIQIDSPMRATDAAGTVWFVVQAQRGTGSNAKYALLIPIHADGTPGAEQEFPAFYGASKIEVLPDGQAVLCGGDRDGHTIHHALIEGWAAFGQPRPLADHLSAAWQPYGAPFAPPTIRRHANGWTVIEGLLRAVAPIALNTPILTLPPGDCPDAYLALTTTANNNDAIAARVDITPDGRMLCVTPRLHWISICLGYQGALR